MNTIPQPGQVWEHYSGNRFTVVLIANEGAVDRDKYPMTAVFQDDLGRVWALPLYEFYRRFTPVDDTAVRKEAGAITTDRQTGTGRER
jgi:hypothetical protein